MSNEPEDQPAASYHPSNVRMVAEETGYSEQAIVEIAEFAAARGIQVKISGIPFGSHRVNLNVETEQSEPDV